MTCAGIEDDAGDAYPALPYAQAPLIACLAILSHFLPRLGVGGSASSMRQVSFRRAV